MVGDKVSSVSVAKFVAAVVSLNSSPESQLDEAEQADLLNQMTSKDDTDSGRKKKTSTRSR